MNQKEYIILTYIIEWYTKEETYPDTCDNEEEKFVQLELLSTVIRYACNLENGSLEGTLWRPARDF